MKKLISLFVLTIMLAGVALALEPNEVFKVNRVRFIDDDVAQPGEQLALSFSFENIGDMKLERSRVSLTVPGLDIRKVYRSYEDISRDEDVKLKMVFQIPPDAEPGYYTAMITLSSDGIRRTMFRPIIVE